MIVGGVQQNTSADFFTWKGIRFGDIQAFCKITTDLPDIVKQLLIAFNVNKSNLQGNSLDFSLSEVIFAKWYS